jgi:hypothetical protein
MNWPSPPQPTVPEAPAPEAHPARFHLPNGTPLVLTWSRKSMYVSLTQRAGVNDPEEAGLLLYLCSPDYDPRKRWRVPAPSETGEDPDLSETAPDLYAAVREDADAWADRNLNHTDFIGLTVLAQAIWFDAHETMVTVAAETTQKKTEENIPTGPSVSAEPSPEETSPSTTTSSTDFPAGTHTQPCTQPGASTEST